MLVMVPIVFLINGFTKHDWLEALLFGLAIAVGLTPEMLPMIVTTNLAKGAVAMSRRKTIVKRLNAIQNFGAMDVLCTDKTGTLTQDKIVLERHINVVGEEDECVLELAYLNSFYQTGLKNLLDVAVLEHGELKARVDDRQGVLARSTRSRSTSRAGACRWSSTSDHDHHQLICKGAVEEMLAVCQWVRDDGARVTELDRPSGDDDAQELVARAQRGWIARRRGGLSRLRHEPRRVLASPTRRSSR